MVEPAPQLALKSCMVTGNPKSVMYISALQGYVDLFGIDVRYEAYIYEPNAVCWSISPTDCHFS